MKNTETYYNLRKENFKTNSKIVEYFKKKYGELIKRLAKT